MNLAGAKLEDLSGTLAVGSICFLGCFLIIDGPTNLFIFVESYVKTGTWALVFAGPSIVLAYAMGIIAQQLADLILSKLLRVHSGTSVSGFMKVSLLENQLVADRYIAALRLQNFLQGACPAFVLLGLGCLSAMRYMGEVRLFGYTAIGGSFLLAAICPLLAQRAAAEAQTLVDLSQRELRKSNPTK